MFVIPGENDPVVPRSESDQIVNAVRNNGVPVWYFVMKGEGHGISKISNDNCKFYATVLFVKKFLLN